MILLHLYGGYVWELNTINTENKLRIYSIAVAAVLTGQSTAACMRFSFDRCRHQQYNFWGLASFEILESLNFSRADNFKSSQQHNSRC